MQKKIIFLTLIVAMILIPYTLFSDSHYTTQVLGSQIFLQYQGISVQGTRSGDTMAKVRIEPFKKIYVRRVTRVRWTNYSDVPIHLKFGSGDRCEEISQAPQRTRLWRLSKGCYITEDPIPRNGVYQIIFTEPGKYNYEIQFVGTNSVETGEIVVLGSPSSIVP